MNFQIHIGCFELGIALIVNNSASPIWIRRCALVGKSDFLKEKVEVLDITKRYEYPENGFDTTKYIIQIKVNRTNKIL